MRRFQDTRALSPCPTPFNLVEYVLWRNDAQDEDIALEIVGPVGSDVWTYGILRSRILCAASGLLELGILPGNRLLLDLGNSGEFPVMFLGAIAAGIIPAPVPGGLKLEDRKRLISAIGATASISPFEDEQLGIPVYSPGAATSKTPIEGIVQGDPDRAAYIVFTSGTSAEPKPVLHAHRAIWARRSMTEGWHGISSTDRVMHAGALNWTFTLGVGLLDPWTCGATSLIPLEGTSSDRFADLIADHHATIFAAVPGIYRRLVRSELPTFPSLRHALSAGEKLPETVRREWYSATGTKIHEAFGQTEVSTFLSGSPTREAPSGTLGYPQPGRLVDVVNEGRKAQTGETGEIAVHRDDPGIMLGYWQKDLQTHQSIEGRWLLTGDLGVKNEDGSIGYLGRSDNILTAGGYRISPTEIEEAMLQHPQIIDAAALDVEVRPGTRVVALFYSASKPLKDDELISHAASNLAKHKRPRVFEYREVLPRSASGKLLRRHLHPATDQKQ